jgi:hypothetical protein
MENDPPIDEVGIPADLYEGSGDSSRDERVDDYFEEQEDEVEQQEIFFERADPTPTPNIFQQAWGYGQSTPIFDRSHRHSFIDLLRQPTSLSLLGMLPPLRTAFQSQFGMQPVVPIKKEHAARFRRLEDSKASHYMDHFFAMFVPDFTAVRAQILIIVIRAVLRAASVSLFLIILSLIN